MFWLSGFIQVNWHIDNFILFYEYNFINYVKYYNGFEVAPLYSGGEGWTVNTVEYEGSINLI